MPVTPIHNNMRRRLVSNAGEKGAYLHEDHSALLAGTSWAQQQPCAAGTEGLTIKGSFNAPQVGSYVENVTQGFISPIIATASGELSMHYPLQTSGTNWGQATGTTANKLVDSAASFTQTVTVGMIVALRNLSDYAVVTAIDSDSQLSLSKDISPSGTNYTLMKGFRPGDTIRLGTAVLDGSAGHTMVEIPRFYYAHDFASGKHKWTISPFGQTGLEIHPAFQSPAGNPHEAVYIGAFEGAISGRGQGNESLAGYNLASAQLNSYAGFQPATNGQRSEFRQVAGNNGGGWQIIDWYIRWAWQLLFLTEYENMDSQQVLGAGVTNWSGATILEYFGNPGGDVWNHSFAPSLNGFSLPDGNNSVNRDTNNRHIGGVLSYRGIENPWGNIWKWVDGVNYNDGRVYLTNDPANYADDISSAPYVDTGVTQSTVNGYISKIHDTPHGLIVAESGGDSNSYIPDNYCYNPGWRVARCGGAASAGALAGFAALRANAASSGRDSFTGSRVCLRI